jgi:phosphonate transport system substrate-binding protein
MRAARYAGEAVYYSDVVVRRDSAYRAFADLKGGKWAYNEPRSHSGYGVVCFHLAGRGETFDYFGGLVEAGSHEAALGLVESGAVAGAAIDSTVLEAELARRPSLASRVRVIDSLGPSPAPPWVISSRLPDELKRCIQNALAAMSDDPRGSQILGAWGIAELRPVGSDDYDLMRQMMRAAVRGGLTAAA